MNNFSFSINDDDISNLLIMAGTKLLKNQKNRDWLKVINKELFKTSADEIMHRILVEGLKKITPNIKVFSEEVGHNINERSDLYWLIDPIDGTASWAEGYGGFVSQLSLIYKNQSIFGLIYWPSEDILWMAKDTKGIFINNKKIAINMKQSKNLILIDNYPEPKGIALEITQKIPNIVYKECGSIGLKAILTLTQEADIFIKNSVFRDWDLAPAFAFLPFLKGRIIDLENNNIKLGDQIEFTNGLMISHDKNIIKNVISHIKR